MSIKTEEAKIVDKRNPYVLQMYAIAHYPTKFHPDYDLVLRAVDAERLLNEALATYKVSILAECEKCVPEEKPNIPIAPGVGCSGCNKSGQVVGHNSCRTQTLQAINSLKV